MEIYKKGKEGLVNLLTDPDLTSEDESNIIRKTLVIVLSPSLIVIAYANAINLFSCNSLTDFLMSIAGIVVFLSLSALLLIVLFTKPFVVIIFFRKIVKAIVNLKFLDWSSFKTYKKCGGYILKLVILLPIIAVIYFIAVVFFHFILSLGAIYVLGHLLFLLGNFIFVYIKRKSTKFANHTNTRIK